ncbi:MAG: hypothetical protein DSM106950_40920 [Stigonema ocellatum SAG 48.90 = DSM 106950]|nr:hypothetical protein [Stigonema ocellatum SAG 48.90 = DSM 106950]
MPLLKPLPREKTPPSQMLRVPTPLIEAVQELSRLHRLGYTNAVLQGLQELISEIDSSSDIDFGTNNEVIKQLALRLSKLESRDQSDSDVDSILKSVTSLEQKLEAIQTRIAQMEGAIALLGQRQQPGPTRRQAFTYHPPPLELQPFNEDNLAKRLAASTSTIRNERETKSPKEFESWCRQRDPGGMGWRYQKDGLYHPVK